MHSINTIKVSLTVPSCSMLQDYVEIEKVKVMIVKESDDPFKRKLPNSFNFVSLKLWEKKNVSGLCLTIGGSGI